MDPAGTDFNADSNDTSRVVDEFSFLIRDKNHDGVLERDEFDDGRSHFDKLSDPDRFDLYDENGDGVITREEFLAGREDDRASEVEDVATQQSIGLNDVSRPRVTGPLSPHQFNSGPLGPRDAED